MGSPRKNEEIFRKELKEKYGDEYTIIGEFKSYSRDKIKMRHNCEKCGNAEFDVFPKDIINEKINRKCPYCSGSKFNIHLLKWYIKENNLPYEVLTESASNGKEKVLFRHLCSDCDNNEFLMTPSNFTRKESNRCPKCANLSRKEKSSEFMKNYYSNHTVHNKRTHDEFVKIVYDLVGDEYTVIGDYISSQEKIKMRHNSNKCNNSIFEVTPNHFIQGYRCSNCYVCKKKTHDEFVKQVYEAVGDEYTVMSEYINDKTHVLLRHNCSVCNNHTWKITPNNFRLGRRCPVCFLNRSKSKYEDQIIEYIKTLGVNNIKRCDRSLINPKELDIVLPDQKIAIEFNGLYWHSSIHERITEMYHIDKINLCNKKGYTLIHIFEDEWVHSQNDIELFLKSVILENKVPIDLIFKDENFNKYYVDYSWCNGHLEMPKGYNLISYQLPTEWWADIHDQVRYENKNNNEDYIPIYDSGYNVYNLI